MSIRKLLNMFIIIILFVIAIFLSVNLYTDISLFICVVASILFVLWVKSVVGNYLNMSLFFVGFSTLYGISGPISAVLGEGLPKIFSIPYYTDAFLISYAIANIGLIVGMAYSSLIYNKNEMNSGQQEISLKLAFKEQKKILNTSITLSLLGSIFEIINLIRIGGFVMLFSGKATYQSLSSSLVFTLPSGHVMVIAFSLMGLYLGTLYVKKSMFLVSKCKILLFLVTAIPYLLINIMLGKRGMLISLILCIFIGITFFAPLKRIKLKIAVLLIVIYFFMSFLYANRGIVSLLIEDRNLFFSLAFNKERLIKALNPGFNEFGAAFGNFSEFYNKYNTNFIPKMGESYVKGLAIPIPSFIYPGNKPQQIGYKFRDEFFPSEANRGSIAGTGFSSILEAYINFKHLGVFAIYFLIGFALQKIDYFYRYKSLPWIILYISTFALTIFFHRTSFGTIFADIFLKAIIIYIISFKFRLLNYEGFVN